MLKLFSLSSLVVAWQRLPYMGFVGTELLKVAGDPTAPAPDLSVGFSFILVGLAPPQCPYTNFLQTSGNLTVSFTISSSRVCLRILLTVLLLPRCSCCFMPQSHMLLLNSRWVHHFLLNIGPLGGPYVSESQPCWATRMCMAFMHCTPS
jgi:hypothetical protein